MSKDDSFKPQVLERFLRYVKIDTQSDPRSERYPSTPGQLELLGLLADELQALGVPDVHRDDFGYVMATLPSTLAPGLLQERQVPTIALLAHVDTSPDVTGKDVKPQIIERYEGGVITLPGDPEQRLDPAEQPALNNTVGHTLVTTDGTTLLGADDKAGVAEIMTVVEHLLAHPEIEHGPVAICFTPDEEIGKGTDHLDTKRLGARFAYTVDGSDAGCLEQETFSGDAAEVTIEGRSEHPGYAKGKMVSAAKLAAEFVHRLPQGRLSPETTGGREGFIHLTNLEGTVREARLSFILRDFETSKLAELRALVEDIAAQVRSLDERAKVRIEFSESYRNMRDAVSEVPFIVKYAEQAVRRAGLTPHYEAVRGGTDGSRLTTLGVPTPNLFTGGHNYHSRREWASVDEMEQAVRTLIELCRIWGEQGMP